MKLSVILLAAGSARRYGGNKLLTVVNGKPMYRNILDRIPEIGFSFYRKIIVTQYEEIGRQLCRSDWVVVRNDQPELGISHSIRLGLEQAGDSDAFLFAVCDQPYLQAVTMKRLIAEYERSDKGIAFVRNGKEPGNPVIFSAAYLEELRCLNGDRGGKAVVRRHMEDCTWVEAEEDRELRDIDRPYGVSLLEELRIDLKRDRIFSIVGAGGKTTTMHRLAEELGELGARVLMTTTTHLWCPAERFVEVKDKKDLERVSDMLGPERRLTVGRRVSGNKITGIGEGLYPELARIPDYLIVEADGAKGLPLKAPAEHEPVIFPGSDVVIGVIGLDSLNRPVREVCHRPELVSGLLGVGEGHLITMEDLNKIARSPQGLRKDVSSEKYRVIFNKADLLDSEAGQDYWVAQDIE